MAPAEGGPRRPSGKPTMDDVASAAGVSRALVSLVMRGSDKVGARSRQAVLDAAEALGYRPNLIARNLASRRTRMIGFIINDLHNPFFPGIADGAYEAAQRLGYRLLVNSAFRNPVDEVAALETFVDLQVDGVILTGGLAPTADIERAGKMVPLVVVSRPMKSAVVDTVNNDDFVGASLVVDHLAGLGHRDIVHISGGTAAGAGRRVAGYRHAMRRHQLEPFVEPGAFTEASGVLAAERVLDSGRAVSAIFAGNDLSALGVIDVLDGAGWRVPDDISLVGYDNTNVAALQHISMTSVEQHRGRLGQLAVELLIERIEGGRTTAVHRIEPPELVVRSTSGPVRRGRARVGTGRK